MTSCLAAMQTMQPLLATCTLHRPCWLRTVALDQVGHDGVALAPVAGQQQVAHAGGRLRSEWVVGSRFAGRWEEPHNKHEPAHHTATRMQQAAGLASCARHSGAPVPSRPLPQARTFILSVPTRSTVVKPGLRKRLVMSLTWGRGQGEAGEAARVVERVSPWGVFRCKAQAQPN